MANILSRMLGAAARTPAAIGQGLSAASSNLVANRFKIAGYLGGTAAGSLYLKQKSEELQAYYGQQEYGRRFGSAFNVAGTMLPLAGIGMSVASFSRMDPIGLLARTGRSVAKTALAPIGMASRGMGKGTPQFLQALKNSGPGIRKPFIYGSAGAAVTGISMFALSRENLFDYAGGSALAAVGVGVFREIAKRSGLGYAAGAMGVTALGLGAAYQASTVPSRNIAEGHISDWRVDQQSTVRKMDFNTAGLSLAMHYNRRQ